MADEKSPFVKGQTVVFQGYAELAEGQEEILTVGERVKIETINDDGSLVVYSDRKDGDGNLIGDQAFPEEVEATGKAEDVPTAEKKPRGKKAATAAAPAAAETATETVAEAAPAPKATKAKKVTKAAGKNATKAPKVVKTEVAVATPEDVLVITDAESVTSILNESEDAVEAAKSLIEQGERTDYTLGGVLHHIYSEGIFKGVTNAATGKAYEGKRGFADFVEKELGIQYRKAMYLVSIYTTFRQLNIDEAKLQEIGWSKAKELVRIARLRDGEGHNTGLGILQENFDDLVEFAKANTREELIGKIQKDFINANGGGSTTGTADRLNRTRYKFTLVGEAANVVNDALEEARKRVEGDSDDAKNNAAFETICGEWAMLNVDMTVEQVIAMVQTKYDVRLEIVEGGTDAEVTTEPEAAQAAEPAMAE